MSRSHDAESPIVSISAITLIVAEMAPAVRFYEALGFDLLYGGEGAAFTSFRAGDGYLNLAVGDRDATSRLWGRTIFHVDDVDALHSRAVDAGIAPQFAPRDAPWGERYFHVTDPDGHELSFARPISE
ncbi:MAG TPA: VOC family protein [Dehalococcoidia bacterium]|nr:VOC family protein [Dehalococcoidia bacterium]